jgi:hypothetical protein
LVRLAGLIYVGAWIVGLLVAPSAPSETGAGSPIAYTQTLSDHGVLASVGSVGDAYDTQLLILSSVPSGSA